MGAVFSSRMGWSASWKPRRIFMAASSGAYPRTSPSRDKTPRSTSCMRHVVVMSLVREAT